MMRKVETLEGLEIPFIVIEQRADGAIIDIPLSYVDYPARPDGDEGPLPEPTVIEIDPSEYGVPASWQDVITLYYFDLKIGRKMFSWQPKPGHIHIATSDGKIGVVSYRPVRANGQILGSVKRTAIPSMLGNPALEIVDGYIAVNGQSYADTEYMDMSTREIQTLGSIVRIRDGIEYPIILKQRPAEEIE